MQFPMLRLFTLQTFKSASRLITNPSRYASYVLFPIYSVNNVTLILKLVFWQSSLGPRRFFLTDLHWSLDFRCLPKSGNYQPLLPKKKDKITPDKPLFVCWWLRFHPDLHCLISAHEFHYLCKLFFGRLQIFPSMFFLLLLL